MEKPLMHSKDMVASNIEAIAALFPNCVTERKDANGKVTRGIDFEKLQQELSNDIIERGEERYQFTWPGKMAAIREANTPTNSALRPDVDGSEDFWNTKNLYIEGDNLEVLKLLQEDYLGKVKMIYIDPPYNTGNDFVYNDDFAESSADFSAKAGMYDEEGNMLLQNYEKNSESNGRFHTDWLNMMYPRLKVARNLLSEDGVIFISIDQNEVENLKKICGDVFGYDKVELYVWDTREPGTLPKTAKKTVRNDNEFIVTVFKNECSLNKFSEQKYIDKINEWNNADNDPRGPWMSANISRGSGASTGGTKSYIITNPNGISFDRDWAISESEYKDLLKEGRIYFSDGGNGVPRKKIFATDIVESIQSSIFEKLKSATSASQELTKMFGIKVFDFPKPVALVKRMINIAADKDSIILDFFSGSGTSAHATMLQNACDDGNRKFIMVQLPELTEEKSEAYKAGYKNICEIGKERIRRAGKKIKAENPSVTNLDTGFRVLKLADSNMKQVYYTPTDTKLQMERTLFDTASNIKEDRTDLDLLFQVMLEKDVTLDAPIRKEEIMGHDVYFVDDTYLVAAFGEKLPEGLIKELAKMQPYNFVMANRGLADDSMADNFEQIFKAYSPDTNCMIL